MYLSTALKPITEILAQNLPQEGPRRSSFSKVLVMIGVLNLVGTRSDPRVGTEIIAKTKMLAKADKGVSLIKIALI